MLNRFQSTITLKQPKLVSFPFVAVLKSYAKKFISFPKSHPFVALVILAIVVALVGASKFSQNTQSSSEASVSSINPSAQISVNKQLVVPIKEKSGKETGQNLTFTLTTIEKSDKILINGKPASTRDGKSFVIANFEINNPTTNQLNVRPVDLIRLVTSDGRTFAPDIHNDTVKVEPLSLKKTRVSFVIANDLRNYKLTFGEISGEKQNIDIAF